MVQSENKSSRWTETELRKLSINELTELIEAARTEKENRIETAKRDLILEFRERAADLGIPIESLAPLLENVTSRKRREGVARKVAPKYQGPQGELWTGRGRTPSWLSSLESDGRKRTEFLVTRNQS